LSNLIIRSEEPHIVLPLDSGDVVVIPRSFFVDVIEGRMSVFDLEGDCGGIMRLIVREWLGEMPS
jgi:hypothetical protein